MDQPVFEHDGASQTADTIIDDGSRQTRRAAEAARQHAATLGEAIEASIHQRPLLAVAVAAALGYAVARIIHRR